MKQVVLDSDIIIDYLRTGKGLLPELLQLQLTEKIELNISTVTVFELFAGKSLKEDEKYLQELISNLNIIPFTVEIARLAGEIKRGRKMNITLADLIIGVTSVYLKASLATRNQSHFLEINKIKFFR